ncbi:MAG TPA: LysM peptidoglycan-binding domain-containing protein [Lachnospiraceae bacterium]|nr:LysM peptidoglycan-binding domain-containing protein [Lachnospiraceae bacterium]
MYESSLGNIKLRNIKLRNSRLRRQKELYTRLTIFVITIGLIIILAVLFGSILSKAQSEDNNDLSYKYYTSILIESGDTLWSITNEYMDKQYYSVESYINEIKNINYLNDDNITTGQHIIIPYYSKEFKS